MRKIQRFFTICLLSISVCGCYSSRIVANPIGEDIVPHKETHWTYLWGLIEQNQINANCPNEGIAKLTVKDNFFYNLLNVATLGIFNPVEVEWECIKEPANPQDPFPDN